MSPSAVRAETIRSLRRQLVSSQQTQSSQQHVPTGLQSLDKLLPGGGLPTSSLIEWIGNDAGQATASIALRSLAAMLTLPGCLAVIDERHDFHAAATQLQGIPLSRVLLVRPPRCPVAATTGSASPSRFVRRSTATHSDALWALEQAARCPGVRVVLYWLDRCSSAVLRRIQLAVERSGVTVMLIRSTSVLGQPSFADLRLHVQTEPPFAQHSLQNRAYSVRLLRSRHGLHHEGMALLHQEPWLEQICSG